MNAVAAMFPYQRRDGESVAQKHARIRAEYAAAGLPWGSPAAASEPRAADNDNAGEREPVWWLGW